MSKRIARPVISFTGNGYYQSFGKWAILNGGGDEVNEKIGRIQVSGPAVQGRPSGP
jgi:hypothetical protein